MKRSCLALFAVMGLASAAWSQTEVLQLVPEEALVFGVVNRLGTADRNLVALGRRMQLPAQSLLKLGQDLLGTDKGLDVQGRLLAVLLLGEDVPEVVLALPVTDYAQFLQPCKPRDRGDGLSEIDRGLGSFLVAKKGSFAVLANANNAGALKKVLAANGKVAAQTKALSSWLDKQDLAVVIPKKGLQTGGDLVRRKLDEFQGIMKALAQPEDAKAAVVMMAGLGRFLKTVQEEVAQAGLGIRLDAAGNFHLASQALFTKDGQLAQVGAGFEKLTADPLAGLTGQPFVLALGGAVTEATMAALMDFSMLAAKETYKDLTADQIRTMEEVYRQTMSGVQGMGFVLGLPRAGEPMFSSAVAVYKVKKDAAQYLREYEKALEQMSVIEKEAKIPGLAAKVKKVKVGDRPALEMSSDLEKALAAQQKGQELDPLGKRLIEVMFGSGKELRFTMVAADSSTVLVGFVPAAKMADQLAAIRQAKPLAQAPEVAKTLALLPKQAQWVGLVNPKGGRDLVAALVAVFAPEGANVQIPPFPATPPLGFAARLTRQGLEGHLVIPSQVQEGIGTIIQGLKRDQ